MTPTEQDKELPESIEQILRFNCPASCDGYGTYAEADGDGNPIPLQCQWCYEYGMPARESITADRKRVALEERIGALDTIHKRLAGSDLNTKHYKIISKMLIESKEGYREAMKQELEKL